MGGDRKGVSVTEKVVELRPPGRCAICGRPAVRAFRSFCSARCRDIDLGRWLSGVYAIESDDYPEDGEGP